MKRAALVVGAAAVLAACEPGPTAPAAAFGRPSFSAFEVTDNLVIPVTLFALVPCANRGLGETIRVEGPLHVLFHLTLTPSGGGTLYEHFQPQGISGIGLSTGEEYHATGITQDGQQLGGLPSTFTFINNFYMIGQGPDNNFRVHETFHFTINANGEVTAFADNFRVTCQ